MAITDEIERLQQAKGDIKDAIEAKGVTVEDNATLSTYDEYIEQIETAGTYQEKTVTPTTQGITVTPDTGYDALSQVNVNGDANLSTDNIKKDVSIFGVTGTFSGEGGFPLERVGTTVTVEAQGAIGKGQPWEGVLNDEYAQQGLGKQELSGDVMNIKEYFSADRRVAVYETADSVKTHTINIFDSNSSSYVPVSVTFPITLDRYWHFTLNEEGTLVVAHNTNSSGTYYAYFIEVDKENKTVALYTSENSYGSSTTAGIRNVTCILDNYIISSNTSGTKVYGAYYYDFETHKVKRVKYYNSSSQLVDWTVQSYCMNSVGMGVFSIRKYGDNTWIQAESDKYINKISFDEDLLLSYTRISIPNIKPSDYPTPAANAPYCISYDLTQISSYRNVVVDETSHYAVDYGAFNPQDLSFTYSGTYVTSATGADNTTFAIALGNNKFVFSRGAAYNVADANSGTDKVLSYYATPSKWQWQPRYTNWVVGNGPLPDTGTVQRILAFPKGSTAEYLIYPSHFYTENDKYYGIASSTLNIGDVGEAQLLFGE